MDIHCLSARLKRSRTGFINDRQISLELQIPEFYFIKMIVYLPSRGIGRATPSGSTRFPAGLSIECSHGVADGGGQQDRGAVDRQLDVGDLVGAVAGVGCGEACRVAELRRFSEFSAMINSF